MGRYIPSRQWLSYHLELCWLAGVLTIVWAVVALVEPREKSSVNVKRFSVIRCLNFQAVTHLFSARHCKLAFFPPNCFIFPFHCILLEQWQLANMYFRNLFLSLFFVFAVGFALVQAEESKGPRGPKITSKVIDIDVLAPSICRQF